MKKKAKSELENILEILEQVSAHVWGVQEEFGTVEAMFSSDLWSGEGSRNNKCHYILRVEWLLGAFVELNAGCQAYAKEHGLDCEEGPKGGLSDEEAK